MSNNHFSNIGEQVQSIVQDAVNSMDFNKLNKDIRNTVNSALSEVNKHLNPGASQREYRKPDYSHARNRNQHLNQKTSTQLELSKEKRSAPAIANKSLPGSISGILFTVFGSIGLGVSLLLLLIFTMAYSLGSVFFSTYPMVVFTVVLPALIISNVMLNIGISQRKRIKRFKGYLKKIGHRNYCAIKELAFGTGRSVRYVAKDLRKMIKIGMFKEAHIDEQESCLMLTYEAYQQYLSAQQELKRRQLEAAKAELRQDIIEAEEETDHTVSQVVEEGRNYIRQLRNANDSILGEEVSVKLFHLEDIIHKIYNHIEKHPDQIDDIRKFSQYYLPTTIKLVNTYKDLDGQTIQRENIISAKAEIEKTLDTINFAFENLLDSLFVDVAMDVTTDISVLETMLAREGLMEKDFK